MDRSSPNYVRPKVVLVLVSYHHKNTMKVAEAMAKIFDCPILSPQEIRPDELMRCDLVGFGSGIYHGRHHEDLLGLDDRLPGSGRRSAFIFSTSAMMGEGKVGKDHSALRGVLQGRGYDIIGEFACKGFNTNSFLRHIGGMNKGRPDTDDLVGAGNFAEKMIRIMSGHADRAGMVGRIDLGGN